MKIEIPSFLSHLLIDEVRGYPIPFFVPMRDGKPQWQFADRKKQELCLEKDLCPICGKKNDKRDWWIVTGPLGMKSRVGSDAPMHERCARFSIEVCPHIHFKKMERRGEPVNDGVRVWDKPDLFFLVKADKIKTFFREGEILFKYRVIRHEDFHYVNNILTPV